jgi:hypothetical protein
MTENQNVRLFEVVKAQDAILHNLSGELGVKTSLYLVFTAFMFSASIQVINFAKDLASPWARWAIVSCSTGAAIALLSGIGLLIAALVREYKIFPSRKMAIWIRSLEAYRAKYPDQPTEDPDDAILKTLIDTAEANKLENEIKAVWITWGARGLFLSVPFVAAGGACAIYAFFNRPF